MNEKLIKLNQSVINTVFPEQNFLADDAGLRNLMLVPLGRQNRTSVGSGYPNDTVILA